MATVIEALHKFIAQRPGLEFGNYCSDWRDTAGRAAYHAEVRSIGKDLQHARALLRACEMAHLTDEAMIAAAREAFSGRLTITKSADGNVTIDYCTGQYWPTEYRRAVCAVASSALWTYWRDECMPEGSRQGATEGAMLYRNPTGKGFVSAGDYLRRTAYREFGRGIASRWFN